MVRVAAPDEAILLLEIQVPCVLCARPQSVASLPRALDWGVARPASSAFPDSRTAQSSRLTSTGAKGCSGGWAEHPAGRTCASGWAVALGKPGGGASSSQGMAPLPLLCQGSRGSGPGPRCPLLDPPPSRPLRGAPSTRRKNLGQVATLPSGIV